MWFEDVLLLLMLSSGVFFIGIPLYKFIKGITPRKRNALAEAKERLELARQDLEAARLNKEAEELYNKMYQESLQSQAEAEQEEFEKQEKRK